MKRSVGIAILSAVFWTTVCGQTIVRHYVGCYIDVDGDSDLEELVDTSSQQTVERCVELCTGRGFTYAGLQDGDECWCGNSYGRHGIEDCSQGCDSSCTGNIIQNCGGVDRNSIYRTQISGHYIGCYLLPEAEPDVVTVDMTPEFCSSYCIQDGSTQLAALRNGNECFCANRPTNLDILLGIGCTTPCAGDSDRTCGGEVAFNTYSIELLGFTSNFYLGCWNHADEGSGDVTLSPGQAMDSEFSNFTICDNNALSIDQCINLCSGLGYAYAALQGGDTCGCGDDFGRHGQAPEQECNNICPGNPLQICGGEDTNSVYRSRVQCDPGQHNLLCTDTCPANCAGEDECDRATGSCNAGCEESWEGVFCDRLEVRSRQLIKYLGCYFDDEDDRDLDIQAGMSSAMTVDTCITECGNRGYTYAGLQDGMECWCGDSFGKHGFASAIFECNDIIFGRCNTPCSGNEEQMCGAENINSIYLTQYTGFYLGCYELYNMTDPIQISSSMTPGVCGTACAGKNIRGLAALRNGDECHCLGRFPTWAHHLSGQCLSPCQGDVRVNCGGENEEFSVYDDEYKDIITIQYVGCYLDDPDDRDLPELLSCDQDYNTVDRCVNLCSERGYRYAGLQNSHECWCGDSYGRHGEGLFCLDPCSGNEDQACGGEFTNSVYRTHTMCPGGTFGFHCEQTCSEYCRLSGLGCDQATGVCLLECLPGWTGLWCNETTGFHGRAIPFDSGAPQKNVMTVLLISAIGLQIMSILQ